MFKRIVGIFIVAFVLNLIWEKLQMPLYVIDISGWDCWRLCIYASFWDAVIITGAYYVIDTPNRKTRYTLSTILCLLVAIFIEKRALAEGRWVYSASMPTILDIGLSPLIQLPLLAITTYEIVSKIKSIAH